MRRFALLALAFLFAFAAAEITLTFGEWDSPIECGKKCKGECDLNVKKHKFECVEVRDWDCWEGLGKCQCKKSCIWESFPGQWCCEHSDKILNRFWSEDSDDE